MPKITQKDQTEGGVQAVALTLQILERLAFRERPGRITDLAEELGTSKTRIFRHLRTLVSLGYIVADPETARYRVGFRLARLGIAVANQFDLLTVSRPVMRKVRDALGHTIVLSKVDADVLYTVEQIDGSSLLTIGVVIGSSLGLHSSAQGKIVLAFGSRDLLPSIMATGLEPRTAKTIVNPERLRKEVATVRSQGWAVAPGETLTGLNALAVPIFDGAGELVATLAALGSVDEIPRQPSERQIATMRAAAEEISTSLFGSRSKDRIAPR